MKFRVGESVTVVTEGDELQVEGMVINVTDSFEYIVSIPSQMVKDNDGKKRLIQGSILKVADKWLRIRSQETSTQKQT